MGSVPWSDGYAGALAADAGRTRSPEVAAGVRAIAEARLRMTIGATSMKVTDEQIAEAIRSLTVRMGYPPSMRELAEETGMSSPASMKWRLERMREKGIVDYEDRKPRTLRLTGGADA